jgi:hypothetical protein
MIQFLIDECLTPRLVEVANRFGYAAHHVQYRQWKSRKDDALLAVIRAEDLTIVTNNWKDFEPMLRREEGASGRDRTAERAAAGADRRFRARPSRDHGCRSPARHGEHRHRRSRKR